MLLDLSLPISKKDRQDAFGNERMASFGHMGTHFDVMNLDFPLELTCRKGIVFDVSSVRDRDIEPDDIALSRVEPEQFVVFFTGFSQEEPYGTKRYFSEHPQLSDRLIDLLLERKISVLGIDCAGVRRGREHTPKDQYCADRGVFVVENLYNLPALLQAAPDGRFTARIFPIHFLDMTGLPCRVVAELP